jgi:hypothetical protein
LSGLTASAAGLRFVCFAIGYPEPNLARGYLDVERRWLNLARCYQFSESLEVDNSSVTHITAVAGPICSMRYKPKRRMKSWPSTSKFTTMVTTPV